MERNLDRRVEVLCPVHDRRFADHLLHVVLTAGLRDSARAWELGSDGRYVRGEEPEPGAPSVDSQELLLDWHAAEARQE
jgi:polyphosphate kinase